MKSPFEGELVRLRARELQDAEDTRRWLNDPNVSLFINVRYPQSLAAQRKRLGEQPPPNYVSALFAIEARSDGRHIGNCGLHAASPEDRLAELGIAIGEADYRGGGYGTDAMRTLCRFGFDVMNLNRIELRVFNDNPRALRVYQKIGFQLESCLRDADFRQGRYRDVLWMGLLRGELR